MMAKRKTKAVDIRAEFEQQLRRMGRPPSAFYLDRHQLDAYIKQFGEPPEYKGVPIKRYDKC